MSDLRKSFAVYVITKNGLNHALKLKAGLPEVDLYVSPRLIAEAPEGSIEMPLPMGPTLADTFKKYDCHIHLISVGAVVRMIAPLLENKKVDPAVVCVDDEANFAVCLLSGHVGRGNQFTSRVAQVLGAQPVITTASDVKGTLTVDILGRDFGWQLDDSDRNVTLGCAAVVNEAPVAFVQECGEPGFWPLDQPLPKGLEYFDSLDAVDPEKYEMLLIVTDRLIEHSHPAHWKKAVIYRPKTLVLGLGCDRDADVDLVERGIALRLEEAGLSIKSVKSMASIEKKADETAFLEISQKQGWPFETFSAEDLDEAEGVENPSETVKKFTGSKTVAEGACLLAAGVSSLLLPKVIYKEEGALRSMTMAVTRLPFKKRKVEIGI